MNIILGIDPGTTTIGFSILQKLPNKKLEIIDFGIIKTTPKIDLKDKLFEIGEDIENLIEKYSPNLVVIEKVFFAKNVKTGIDVSHARGVIMYLVAKKGIKIEELTPLQAKKAISGNGRADKKQMQHCIKMLLGIDFSITQDDAADATCLAYVGAINL